MKVFSKRFTDRIEKEIKNIDLSVFLIEVYGLSYEDSMEKIAKYLNIQPDYVNDYKYFPPNDI